MMDNILSGIGFALLIGIEKKILGVIMSNAGSKVLGRWPTRDCCAQSNASGLALSKISDHEVCCP